MFNPDAKLEETFKILKTFFQVSPLKFEFVAQKMCRE